MKKIICLLLAMLLLAGCAPAEPEPYVPTGDALVMDDGSTVETKTLETEPEELHSLTMVYYPEKSMNPLKSTDFTNRALFSLIYQGLFSTDRDYQVQPVLCRHFYVSSDMMTYRFTLENATFSDGSPVTEQDVVASLNAAMEAPYYEGRFNYVKSVEIGESGGVVIQLHTAYENFPILLDVPILKATELDSENPVGSGPYIFRRNARGGGLRLNDRWWSNAELPISAPSITLLDGKTPAQIRDEFEFGDVDLVCANPASDAYADYRCDYELWDCENGTFLYLGCNLDSTVFSNEVVRSALTHAIDRSLLVDKYYRGFGRAATLPASPQSPYYDSGLAEEYAYDGVKFVQALDETELKGSKVSLLVNKDDSLRLRVGRAIAKMLTDCGLVVELKEEHTARYRECLLYRTYDLYLGQTRLSPNMDLSQFFYVYGELSYGRMADNGLYAMCMEALANSGNYYNLHQRVMDDGRLCPILFCGYSVYATRGALTQLKPARDNIFCYDTGKTLEDAYVDVD